MRLLRHAATSCAIKSAHFLTLTYSTVSNDLNLESIVLKAESTHRSVFAVDKIEPL